MRLLEYGISFMIVGVQVVNERVGRLKSLSREKRRSSMVQLSGAAGKPGQAAMLTEAAIKQGARRQTWMGPVYLGCPADSDIVSTGLSHYNKGLSY